MKPLAFGSVRSGISEGDRVGRLTVIARIPGHRCDQWRWLCRCDCGRELNITGSRLKYGGNKSCGCFRRDRAGALYRTHGKSKTAEYLMFYDARKRAMAQGVPFEIVPEDIVIPSRCPVLGIALRQGTRETTPSLDKIEPALGYTPANIKVISFRANRLKSDATPEELQLILKYIGGVR